jgi:hypothetical protein
LAWSTQNTPTRYFALSLVIRLGPFSKRLFGRTVRAVRFAAFLFASPLFVVSEAILRAV